MGFVFKRTIAIQVVLLMLGFGSKLSAQQVTGSSNTIPDSINLRERIFLHNDRDFYLCGEIMWFKAYIVDAANNHPISLSKVAYVELLDKSNRPVSQGKIGIDSGFGNGSLMLPSSLASGIYRLRAYTNWMQNFSASFYFEKSITIINTTRNLEPSALQTDDTYTASLFPEGGNLVEGLPSEVGFRIADEKNEGAAARGYLTTQAGDTITQFDTHLHGLGHFSFTPQPQTKYSVTFLLANGTRVTKDLPNIYSEGYVMHVNDSTSNDIRVVVRRKGLETSGNAIYAMVANGHSKSWSQTQSLENGQTTFLIDRASLKEGISTITIFDQALRVWCERVYFIQPTESLRILAKPDKASYSTREKVTMEIATAASGGGAINANLSVAVYRLDSLQSSNNDNIVSYLSLTSSLNGTVEDPGYYFQLGNPDLAGNLHDLLLTQGWRTFNWDANDLPRTARLNYFPEISGHIITGKIVDSVTGAPVSNVLVYLSVPGRRVQLMGCISDSLGLLHFNMKDFYGANQIILQTNLGVRNKYRIEIFSPFSSVVSKDALPRFYVNQGQQNVLQANNTYVRAESVYHDDDLAKVSMPAIDSTPFYLKADKTYVLDDYTRFTTMEEVMREFVAEVSVRRRGDNYHFLTTNIPARQLMDRQPVELLFDIDPLVLLDGVPVFDINKIIAYSALKVQKIDVVASKYFWGPITSFGIVSCTTYKGNLEGYQLNPEDLLLDYDGLQQQRIFYAPDYSAPELKASHRPDFRNVLYWSPNVITGGSGKSNISFYTGDIPGTYIAVFEGITSDGQPGSQTVKFSVTK